LLKNQAIAAIPVDAGGHAGGEAINTGFEGDRLGGIRTGEQGEIFARFAISAADAPPLGVEKGGDRLAGEIELVGVAPQPESSGPDDEPLFKNLSSTA
jgi:hypothetical protein